jgi:hypothetical protein
MKDLGIARKIFGMEIHRDKEAGKLWVSHKNFQAGVREVHYGKC